MDYQLLCSWLGLPAAAWPPNHFVLLGLEPGVHDAMEMKPAFRNAWASFAGTS